MSLNKINIHFLLNENDIIQGRMLSYMEIFKPLLLEKKTSLQEKYAMTDPISLISWILRVY